MDDTTDTPRRGGGLWAGAGVLTVLLLVFGILWATRGSTPTSSLGSGAPGVPAVGAVTGSPPACPGGTDASDGTSTSNSSDAAGAAVTAPPIPGSVEPLPPSVLAPTAPAAQEPDVGVGPGAVRGAGRNAVAPAPPPSAVEPVTPPADCGSGSSGSCIVAPAAPAMSSGPGTTTACTTGCGTVVEARSPMPGDTSPDPAAAVAEPVEPCLPPTSSPGDGCDGSPDAGACAPPPACDTNLLAVTVTAARSGGDAVLTLSVTSHAPSACTAATGVPAATFQAEQGGTVVWEAVCGHTGPPAGPAACPDIARLITLQPGVPQSFPQTWAAAPSGTYAVAGTFDGVTATTTLT